MRFEELNSTHIRALFKCEHESLNYYITTIASQDIKRDLTKCFVLVDEKNIVKAYYTLSAASIPTEDIPIEFKKRIPKAYSIPAILIGRLARDISMHGSGCGEYLLVNAFKRIVKLTESLGVMAVVVDPIDDKAISFYQKYGFVLLESGKMFKTMKSIRTFVAAILE